MKGKFITFEGNEGCGKSTQARLLSDYLKRKGHRVIFLREPGGTKISEKIRSILLDAENDSMSPACEMLLYMAARAQIVQEIIGPALLKGKTVICDRFLDSTIVYQGYGLGQNISLIKKLGKVSTYGIKPDLTILLDEATEEGLRRCGRVKDRIEQRSISYHQRVRRGYLHLASLNRRRIKVVKVEKNKNLTQRKIRGIVEDVI
ncbi:dTMP kinase [Candidatus Omnitrophota bacterium]